MRQPTYYTHPPKGTDPARGSFTPKPKAKPSKGKPKGKR